MALINQYEKQIYSQNGEDGIIEYIFSIINITNKRCIEFGIGEVVGSNTANLIINHGWGGLLMDQDSKITESAIKYYNDNFSHVFGPLKHTRIINQLVTTDNINNIFKDNGFSGEIDLLSIDIDGNDYWVWKAINEVNPRVLVIEYNPSFGDERSITVKYKENFNRFDIHPAYHGASLEALVRLAAHKGYSLNACDKSGCNAFFVRNDLMKDLQCLTAKQAYYDSSRRERNEEIFDQIKYLEFIDVGIEPHI